MSDTPEYTPEILIGQYILGAYMLGQRFTDGPPLKSYIDDTVHAMIRDLEEHGYVIVAQVPA